MIDRISAQYRAVMRLLQDRSSYDDLLSMCTSVLPLISETINSERVSVWEFNDARTAILCKSLYSSKTKTFINGTLLSENEFPSYFNAINTEQLLVVDDVYAHPATTEFVEVYMRPNGISSMLDVLLCDSDRRPWGVLCLERVLPAPVPWEYDEQNFAFTAGDYLAIEIDRFRKQEQMSRLLTTQRLESLGRMAGGVAHGMNNTLAIIGNAFALIRESIEEKGAEVDELILNNVSMAIDRGANLTRQLLIFSSDETSMADKIVDIREEIKLSRGILEAVLSRHVDLQLKLPDMRMDVNIDPKMLNQILLNLVSNSRDAIETTGIVSVELRQCDLPTEFLRAPSSAVGSADKWALLTVSDNGRGMTEDVRARCLEPFYTTKSVNKGTGLGLSTVFGVVKACCGYMYIYSEQGKGTTIKIYLPMMSNAESVIAKSPKMTDIPKILLVDDDEALLETTHRLIKNCGCEVLAFTSATEAIKCFESAPEKISLLVTDVIMPEMNGVELANLLRSKNPKLEIILISGFTDNALADMSISSGDYKFLNKPFPIRELRELITSTLS